jgi:hypothetical protein
LDLSYIGKGALYGVNAKISNTVAITRNWPESKEELAALLRNCRFFYTADSCSHINNEALSCGALPVFLHNGPWTDAELDSFEAGAMPRLRLGEIIDEARCDEFERARDVYLDRMATIERQWELSVRALIEKVDLHFAVPRQARSNPAPAPARKPSQRLSRKERKRWMKNAGRSPETPASGR